MTVRAGGSRYLEQSSGVTVLPAAYAVGSVRFGQLLVVAVVVGAADICFRAVSGACLKGLVAREHLLSAQRRFESTTWTATMVGPPLGGALIGIFGPVTTVIADAASYLLSALGVTAIAGHEARPVRVVSGRTRRGEVLEGWRYIWRPPTAGTARQHGAGQRADHGAHPAHRRADARPAAHRAVAVLTGLRRAGPSRLPSSLGLGRVGARRADRARACHLLRSVQPGVHHLPARHTPADRLARTLAAWTITTKLSVAALTATWGVPASLAGVRTAIASAGVLMLANPLLLPTRNRHDSADHEPATLVAA
jgi:hypothetical protein